MLLHNKGFLVWSHLTFAVSVTLVFSAETLNSVFWELKLRHSSRYYLLNVQSSIRVVTFKVSITETAPGRKWLYRCCSALREALNQQLDFRRIDEMPWNCFSSECFCHDCLWCHNSCEYNILFINTGLQEKFYVHHLSSRWTLQCLQAAPPPHKSGDHHVLSCLFYCCRDLSGFPFKLMWSEVINMTFSAMFDECRHEWSAERHSSTVKVKLRGAL